MSRLNLKTMTEPPPTPPPPYLLTSHQAGRDGSDELGCELLFDEDEHWDPPSGANCFPVHKILGPPPLVSPLGFWRRVAKNAGDVEGTGTALWG